MRDNFERFGRWVSLDTMKRGISKWFWPHMAIVVYGEMRKVCLGYEGLMIGEKKEAYDFMCKFLCGRSPGRDVVHVRVVAGEDFWPGDNIYVWTHICQICSRLASLV